MGGLGSLLMRMTDDEKSDLGISDEICLVDHCGSWDSVCWLAYTFAEALALDSLFVTRVG